ncbi:MAG: aldo/keto reductase [Burkholderiales bacterium]
MIYKKVKKIKEEISAIGIGCWNFGGDWDTSNDKEAINIVHAAIDNGINLFDVAPVYGWHHAEKVLGTALKNGKREKVLIASKCGLVWDEKHVTVNDLSKKNILREIDESLERLQTDYIDIYQLHWPDPKTPIEETVSALEEIKKAGKIRYIGLSNFSQKDVETFMSMIEINAQQGLYNMLERNTSSYHGIPLEYKTEKEMLVTVRKEGQAFLPYSPLFQGLLAGRFKGGHRFSKKDIRNENPKFFGETYEKYYKGYEEIQAIADEIGRPVNELAINWLRQKPEVTSIINGVSSLQQLQKNIDSIKWDISDEYMAKIETIIAPFEDM